MNERTFFLTVMLVLFIGAIGYLAWLAQPFDTAQDRLPVTVPQTPVVAPAPASETPSEDETASWKTYRNEVYGFEVRHPQDWYTKEHILGDNDVAFQLLFDQSLITEDHALLRYPTHPWYELNIIALKNEHPEENLMRSGLSQGDPVEGTSTVYNQFRYDPIIFVGMTANKITSASPPDVDSPTTEIVFNVSDYGWSIFYPNTDYSGSHDPIYDQILSTFKFIEKEETTILAYEDLFSCEFWKDKEFRNLMSVYNISDYAGSVTIRGNIRVIEEPAAWEENKTVSTVVLEVVPQTNDPLKTFYEEYMARVRKGNFVNSSEDNLLLFTIGILESGRIFSTASISEDTHSKLIGALNYGMLATLRLTIPLYPGMGAPDEFSFACAILHL